MRALLPPEGDCAARTWSSAWAASLAATSVATSTLSAACWRVIRARCSEWKCCERLHPTTPSDCRSLHRCGQAGACSAARCSISSLPPDTHQYLPIFAITKPQPFAPNIFILCSLSNTQFDISSEAVIELFRIIKFSFLCICSYSFEVRFYCTEPILNSASFKLTCKPLIPKRIIRSTFLLKDVNLGIVPRYDEK